MYQIYENTLQEIALQVSQSYFIFPIRRELILQRQQLIEVFLKFFASSFFFSQLRQQDVLFPLPSVTSRTTKWEGKH